MITADLLWRFGPYGCSSYNQSIVYGISSACCDNCLTHFYKWLVLVCNIHNECYKSKPVTLKKKKGNYLSRLTIYDVDSNRNQFQVYHSCNTTPNWLPKNYLQMQVKINISFIFLIFSFIDWTKLMSWTNYLLLVKVSHATFSEAYRKFARSRKFKIMMNKKYNWISGPTIRVCICYH